MSHLWKTEWSLKKILELLQHLQYPLDLAPSDFFYFETWKKARLTTVHVERGHHPDRCLFWGSSEILLFGRLKKVGETLGKVYRVKRTLCWKKKIYTKSFFFLSFSKDLLNDLRSFPPIQRRSCSRSRRRYEVFHGFANISE